LRVLLADAHLRDPTLGAPKLVLRLGAGLEELGHEVDYLFADDVPAWLRERRVLYASFPALVAQRALKGNHDVVHVASGDSAMLGPLSISRRRGRWVLVNLVHGMEHIHWKELKRFHAKRGGGLNLRHRMLYGGVRLREVELSVRWSDAIHCQCEQDRRFVVEHGWQPESKVFVVQPGVDDVYLKSSPARLTEPSIFFLGTWTPRKGVFELVEAFAQVVDKVPRAQLVVAGAHRDAEVVLSDFPEPLRKNVTVLPTVPDPPQRLIEVMQACSVGVLPSHYEGFGMAFLEMMSVGLPVIGTETGGMPDIIQDGQNGLIVPARDPARLAQALIDVLSNEAERRRMAAAATQTARGYTWRRQAEALTVLYESILPKV
jgi:glycosyltransferase involved in cell wall biosynthesis